MYKKIFQKLISKYRQLKWEIYKKFKLTLQFQAIIGKYEFKVINDDPINYQLYVSGNYELDYIEKAVPFLKKEYDIQSDTVVDIGANNGVISITLLLKNYFNNAIAVEPDPVNFNNLKRNIELNSLKNRIFMFNGAVSDKKGELEFELCPYNYGDHRVRMNSNDTFNGEMLYSEDKRNTILIESNSLEYYISNHQENISLIWIDIQGFEPYVFKGAKELFKNSQKIIPVVSEFWPYGMQRAGISKEEFINIVSEIFSHFLVLRKNRFIKYDIKYIELFYDEVNFEDNYDTVIYLND